MSDSSMSDSSMSDSAEKPINLSDKKKAAIVLKMMGLDEAANVTRYMNQLDVRELARIASDMKNVSGEYLNSITKEFLDMIADSSDMITFDEDFSSEIIKRSANEDHFLSLDFLQRADKKQLMEIIHNEHPQVIAFILSYIPPDQAGAVLSRLSQEQHADIAYRISTMETPNRMALIHLDKMLGEKLSSLASSSSMDVGGVDSLVKIMRGVGRSSERTILEHLESQHPELCEEIKNRMFVFEDIVLLDNRGIQKVLKEVDKNILAMALKKTTPEIKELITQNMSERAKAALIEDIGSMGKVRLREVEVAQQEIVEIIRRMEESEEIVVRREEEVYV